MFELGSLSLALLAAVRGRWPGWSPGRTPLPGKRWLWLAEAFIGMVTLICILFVVFEQNLPLLVSSTGSFTLLILSLDWGFMALFSIGAVLSIRRYLRTGDKLLGYVALTQMSLIFVVLTAIIGAKRYDIWYYLSRIIIVWGFLILMFGLLSEYVRLYRRERESEARYRQLTESLPQLIWTCTPDGLCDFLSPQWVAYSGIPAEQQLGQKWLEQLHPDDRERAINAWNASTATGKTFETEYRLRRHDGVYRWFKALALPIRNLEGRITKWFGSCTDIEAQKQYESQLERSNRDLRNFTVVASHDLQEPLRKIETFGDVVLEDSSKLAPRQFDGIVRMQKSVQQMRKMVDGLLQLSLLSTDAQPFQPVDLRQITSEILTDLDERIRRLDGIVELSELPIIEADPLQMRRLFQQLIDNALKFQPSGGKPYVHISSNQPTPAWVQILVEDNGIGFDETHAAHLFEPFERLVGKNQTEYEGTGMGLALCRWIVERHGGEIAAQSKPGQGTMVIITLPLHQTESSWTNTRKDANIAKQAIPFGR